MSRLRFGSLASRMAAVAVLQLVLLGLTGAIVAFATRPLGEARPEDHLVPGKFESIVSDEEAMYRELARLRDERIAVSIYNSQRQLVATNVDPPLAPPIPRFGSGGPPSLERMPLPPAMFMPRDRPFVVPFMAGDERRFLVARGQRAEPPGWIGPVLIFSCAFSILVLGAIVTARWIVRPIRRLSSTARALGTGDLRARVRLERSDEIGELGHRVDEMADRIEALVRSERELLANVAHELRTPLARIGVALDLAAEGDATAARASLDEIAADVSELERIFDDILTTLRFEIQPAVSEPQFPLRRQPTPPVEIVDAAVARHNALHPGRRLDVAVEPRLPAIDVDPVLVRRVIDNLLDNAHKYTPDPEAATRLAVRSHADHVVFEIADAGIGIADDELPHVFDAFYRTDRSRSRGSGGVGLGLTLAKRIVEAHRGTIQIASEQGAGTTVRVELPATA